MPTLNEVQNLFESGNKKEAVKLLQDVLRENPSADGWYTAALMTRKPEATLKYLERALAIDPKHKQARKAIKAVQNNMADTQAVDDNEATSNKKKSSLPALRSLTALDPATLRIYGVMATGVVLMIVVMFTVVSAIGNMAATQLAGGGTFNVTRTMLIAPEDVIAQFGGAEVLQPVDVEGAAFQQWETAVEGHNIKVFLYDSIDDMSVDRQLWFESMKQNYTLTTYHSVAMLYPSDLSPEAAQQVNVALRGIPLNGGEAAPGTGLTVPQAAPEEAPVVEGSGI